MPACCSPVSCSSTSRAWPSRGTSSLFRKFMASSPPVLHLGTASLVRTAYRHPGCYHGCDGDQTRSGLNDCRQPQPGTDDHLTSVEAHGISLIQNSLYLQDSQAVSPTPVDTLQIRGHQVFVKRDDKVSICRQLAARTFLIQDCAYTLQLDLFGQGVHGNKARKLLFLSQLEEDTLPDLFVSYGGLQVIACTVAHPVSKSLISGAWLSVCRAMPWPRWPAWSVGIYRSPCCTSSKDRSPDGSSRGLAATTSGHGT